MKRQDVMKVAAMGLLLFFSMAEARAQVVITPAMEQKAKELCSKMTLEEKIDYLGGDKDGFSIRAIPRLGIPQVKMADGPQGMRNNVKSTLYPCGILSAASWNRNLVHRLGNCLGEDFHAYGIGFLLGPGVNIYRAPMNGRNFEYFGEDPYLASETAVQYILGVQEKGTIATIKHFALNNEEWDRHQVSSDADERTMEEIYFPTFRKAVEKAGVGAVMNSYNLVNGIHAAENPWLLKNKLRDEWGFKGIVMSDWGSTYTGFNSAMNGLDLEMPHGDFMNRKTLIPLVRSGVLPESVIDEHVQHILQTLIAFHLLDKPLPVTHPKDQDLKESRQTALDMAREGIVLLKNQGQMLPLKGSIAVIGPNADRLVKGGGSGQVTPFRAVTLWQGLHAATAKARLIEEGQWLDKLSIPFQAEYFNNKQMEGTPVLAREEKEINHDWGENAPAEGINKDGFSARWRATYTPDHDMKVLITARGDDGFRLNINGKKLLDKWYQHEALTTTVAYTFEKGKPYQIDFQYYEEKGSAEVGLKIVSCNTHRLEGLLKKFDNVIVAEGFDANTEGEGHDRPFCLDEVQTTLIDAATAANDHVAVVINSGGGVEMQSWIDKVKAVVMAWYPGQEGGTALADILTGKVAPSGKLPISIEARWEDNPDHGSYYENEKTKKRVLYTEGIFTGYRGYDQNGTKPLFPFGFGLSYTTFAYSNIKVQQDGKGNMVVSFDIKNTGKRDASEVAQVYVHEQDCPVPRPQKELKEYRKVFIKRGTTQHVDIPLTRETFQYYDVNRHQFSVAPGAFDILVGGSSADLPLKATIHYQ